MPMSWKKMPGTILFPSLIFKEGDVGHHENVKPWVTLRCMVVMLSSKGFL